MSTPTPEQLAQWRDDGDRAWMSDLSIDMRAHPQAMYAAGYLRARTEQAIKDAREQVMEEVIQCVNSERGSSTDNLILALRELLTDCH